MNDIIAHKFHYPAERDDRIGRIGTLVLPPLVYFIAYRWRWPRSAATDQTEHGGRRHHHAARRTAPTSSCTSRWARSTTTATIPLEYQGAPLPKRDE